MPCPQDVDYEDECYSEYSESEEDGLAQTEEEAEENYYPRIILYVSDLRPTKVKSGRRLGNAEWPPEFLKKEMGVQADRR